MIHPWWRLGTWLTCVHGTSSALMPEIRAHGLKPPAEAVESYALGVLHDYVPGATLAQRRTKAVLRRATACRNDYFERNGPVLFAFPHSSRARAGGYARSYHKHGGEIAYLVHQTLTFDKRRKPIAPRFADAQPMVVEFNVRFVDLTEATRTRLTLTVGNLTRLWQDPTPRLRCKEYATLDDLFLEHSDHLEIKIDAAVPPEQIICFHEVGDESRID